jgi:hypothetical protein
MSTTPARNSVAAVSPLMAPPANALDVRKSVARWSSASREAVSTGRGPDMITRCSSSHPSTAEAERLSHSLRTARTMPVTTPPTRARMPRNAAAVASRGDQPRPVSQRTSGLTAEARMRATSTEITTSDTRSRIHVSPASTAATSRTWAEREPARPRGSDHGPTAGSTARATPPGSAAGPSGGPPEGADAARAPGASESAPADPVPGSGEGRSGVGEVLMGRLLVVGPAVPFERPALDGVRVLPRPVEHRGPGRGRRCYPRASA